MFRILLPLCFLVFSSLCWADEFVAGMGDLPLAPGLSSTEDDVMIIDDEDQRIVETEARGVENPQDVQAYYQKVLPNLGWERQGPHFEREGEILTLQLVGNKAIFRITPMK